MPHRFTEFSASSRFDLKSYFRVALSSSSLKLTGIQGSLDAPLSTNRLHLDEVTYEVLNDFLLPWLFICVLMTPPVINWRGRKIRVTDGKIRYE